MSNYKIVFTKQAQKDAKKIASGGLKVKVQSLLKILEKYPFKKYPPYEALIGDLKGTYSRRINIQYRLVYQVLEDQKVVKIIRMWTYYQ